MKSVNMVLRETILAASMILILVPHALAHGNEQHVMGTVAKIEGLSVTVKATDGTLKTVMISSETRFLKNSSPATQKDLKIGDRVVIHAKHEGSMLHATEVKIGDKVSQQR